VEELDRVVTKVATSSARREREFIEQRLAEEKNQLDVSQRQFSAFASSNMALDVPQQTRVTVESAARLEGELIARKSELEGLTQIYARDNFRVKSAQARVAELEKALNKLNSGPDKTGGAQDPTNPYPSVRSLPQLGVTWTDLYRTIKIHETVFELLTQQFEMAKIQEAKEIPTVKILDAATTPEKRYPRPWIVTLVGGVLSLLLSCAGVVLYNGWENLGPEDSRRVLVARVRRGFTNPRSFVIPRSSRESASQERDRANDYSERRL
jgi:capsule polysaccharide export protein KpsE/RkpR